MSKKRKKGKKTPLDYEGYQIGPFILERLGRETSLRNNLSEAEHQKIIERIRVDRSKYKESINQKIQELIEIFKNSNPFELLSFLSIRNCFYNLETFSEMTCQNNEAHVEYALGIATGIDSYDLNKHAPSETLLRCAELINEIFDILIWYFISEIPMEGSNRYSCQRKFNSIMRYLNFRGDSYPQHHTEMIRDLFTPHDYFLISNFCISTQQILSAIDNIVNQIFNHLSKHREIYQKSNKLHKKFLKQLDAGEFSDCKNIEEMRVKHSNNQDFIEGKQELECLQREVPEILFEIRANEHISIKFLELISMNLGDNAGFISFERAPAWPTNNSIVYDKPIIKHDYKYYCFSPQILYRNLKNIIEGWIQNKNSNYFEEKYAKKRGSYVEKKGLEYFGRLLPNASIYSNLYYTVMDDGKIKRVETDGIILFDNNLFIFEAKSSSLSLASRRGAERSIKKDIDEIVDKAYTQAIRTKNYIENTDIPRFYDASGQFILEISDKSIYKNIFLLNVTLENIGSWSANLNSVKELGLIQGREWPWSIFINDLRIISEINEYPTQFLLYLKRRLRANDFPQFKPFDELDFYMFYLNDGLYFEDCELPSYGHLLPTGYTEELDRYYHYIHGYVSSGEKPKFKANIEIQEMVKEIEEKCRNKINFTEITSVLLGFSAETQNQFIEMFKSRIRLSEQERKNYDITIVTDNFGFTTFIINTIKIDLLDNSDKYCSLNMYETKKERWYCLFVNLNNPSNRTFDFKIYEKKWIFNQELEDNVKLRKEKHVHTITQKYGKIGRNDKCPCGSGEKYKRCCGSVKN